MKAIKKKSVRRLRRKRHIRKSVTGTADRPRLTVFRSAKHIYCQVIDDFTGVTIASASTQLKEISEAGSTGNVKGAEAVGALLAGRLKDKGVEAVSFDRNGYKYHGRIEALAETLRKEGIKV